MQLIFRLEHKTQYTVITNQVLQNRKLSWEARGLLAYLLSLPVYWEMNVVHLEMGSPNAKRKKLLKIINELRDAGHIIREEIRDKNGRVHKVRYSIFEKPKFDTTTRRNIEMIGEMVNG